MVGELAAAWYDPDGTKPAADTLAFVRAVSGVAGALAGGSAQSVTTGALTGVNAAQNNRMLHPTEAQWIRQNARRYAQQQGISEAEAQRQLAQQAYRQVQFGTPGDWDAAASAFLGQARGMLPASGNSGPGYAFQATPAQKADASMYAEQIPAMADFYIANGLKLPSTQDIVNAVLKDGEQRAVLSGLTLGAGTAAGLIVLAVVNPNLTAWVLQNPDKAVQTGLIAAETALAVASGAITPASMTETIGQGLGRALTAAEKAAVQELTLSLKAVSQQKPPWCRPSAWRNSPNCSAARTPPTSFRLEARSIPPQSIQLAPHEPWIPAV